MLPSRSGILAEAVSIPSTLYSKDNLFLSLLFGMSVFQKQPPETFFKNFTKFTGKHLCQSRFFNKVACPSPIISLQNRLWQSCFPVYLVKFLRTFFKQSTSGKFWNLRESRFLILKCNKSAAEALIYLVSFSWLSLPHAFFCSGLNWNCWRMVERMTLLLHVFSSE